MIYFRARCVEALISFFEKDYRRIDHALSVLMHAEQIARERTGWDKDVLIAAALLHDVGIKPAEALHGCNDGPLQEKYGPPEAERILHSIGLTEGSISRVLEIIGNHHSRSRYDYVELEILKEADAVVNRAEREDEKNHHAR